MRSRLRHRAAPTTSTSDLSLPTAAAACLPRAQNKAPKQELRRCGAWGGRGRQGEIADRASQGEDSPHTCKAFRGWQDMPRLEFEQLSSPLTHILSVCLVYTPWYTYLELWACPQAHSICSTRSTLVPPEMPSWIPLITTHTSPVLQRPLTLAVARQRAMSEAEPTMDPTTMG